MNLHEYLSIGDKKRLTKVLTECKEFSVRKIENGRYKNMWGCKIKFDGVEKNMEHTHFIEEHSLKHVSIMNAVNKAIAQLEESH